MSEGFYKHMSSPRMDHRYSQMANLPLSVLQKIFTYFWFDALSASKANTLITRFSENKDFCLQILFLYLHSVILFKVYFKQVRLANEDLSGLNAQILEVFYSMDAISDVNVVLALRVKE